MSATTTSFEAMCAWWRVELDRLEAAAAEFSRAWIRHRHACAVCSKGATRADGDDFRCSSGEVLRAKWTAAERGYARRLNEATA